jgi:molybdopterin-guanine dinucleotide biosynthesis protein A
MINQITLTRPDIPASGSFGRNEYAFMGSPCPVIQQLCLKLITGLSATYKTAYVDADHRSGQTSLIPNKQVMNSGGLFELTNKLDYFQLNLRKELNQYDHRAMMNEADLVLVNGNHFEASRQILILDPVKFDSLSRNIAKLKKVELVLTTEKTSDLPLFLKDYLPDYESIPILSVSNTTEIEAFITRQMSANTAPIRGLILAGGKSSRMGTDKSHLVYDGVTQSERISLLMQELNIPCFFSCRDEQKATFSGEENLITDTFLGMGPMGGILSAFRSQPDTAWLVMATDMPLLSSKTIDYLLLNRRSSAVATAIINGDSGDPEPLVAIWEPKSYQVLLNFLGQGVTSPAFVLKNSDTHLIQAPAQVELQNVNTPEDYQSVIDQLSPPKQS